MPRDSFQPQYGETGGRMGEKKESVEAAARTIRRVTHKKYLAEEKIRIVLEGLRGATSIADSGRRDGIASF